MWTTEHRPAPLPATGGRPATRVLPPGAVRWSLRPEVFTDGSFHTVPVPVDEQGREVTERAVEPGWLARLLPWGSIRHRMRHTVRPFLVAGGVAGVAALVDSHHLPAGVVAAGAVLATSAAWVMAPRFLVRGDVADGETGGGRGRPRRVRLSDLAGRALEKTQRRRRLAAYLTATAGGWLTVADVAGLDPHTFGGAGSWTALAVLVPVCGRPYWVHHRTRPQLQAAPEQPGQWTLEEKIALRWAETVGAVAQPERKVPSPIPGAAPDIQPAVSGGKLPGTVLTEVRRVAGGWAAWIVDPQARGLDWLGTSNNGGGGPRRQIAAVFGVGLSAVTLEPDGDDATRCFVMVQKQSPLAKTIRFRGPDSFDVPNGRAVAGMYADGVDVPYEVYRPGFGSPHVFICSTTGGGKSELINLLFAIERWFAAPDGDGVLRGLVCSFLIDPQQGQSFEPFMEDLAAPVATSLDEAMLLVRALNAEALRRNAYLSRTGWRDPRGVVHRAQWTDPKGRTRYGRKWWNPLVDGPILSLTIDEAHEYLAHKPFCHEVTKAGRMWRKCGLQVKVATHTPLLQDLGGSMPLRDMLTGGFVWVGRTANSLSGPTAFNGRLPADPRAIPAIPGWGYAMSAVNPRAMMMRAAWEPDFYDWVRDERERPIGHPGVLPPVTLDTFGQEFARWRVTGECVAPAGVAKPASAAEDPAEVQRREDAVVGVLLAADGPLSMDQLDEALKPYRAQGVRCSLRTARAVIKRLREQRKMPDTHGGYELSPGFRQELLTQRADGGPAVQRQAGGRSL